MNFFCRFLGHTWVHEAVDPKIGWNNDKDQIELQITATAKPEFHRRCVRCGERRPWSECGQG